MREIIVSATVLDKLSDLVSYLKNDIRLSEDAAQAYRKRFIAYIQTFGAESIIPCAVSGDGANWAIAVPYSRNTGCWPMKLPTKV